MKFTIAGLKESTNDFSEEQVIGKGGYVCVYRGTNLRKSGTNAAIKLLTKVGWYDMLYGIVSALCMW